MGVKLKLSIDNFVISEEQKGLLNAALFGKGKSIRRTMSNDHPVIRIKKLMGRFNNIKVIYTRYGLYYLKVSNKLFTGLNNLPNPYETNFENLLLEKYNKHYDEFLDLIKVWKLGEGKPIPVEPFKFGRHISICGNHKHIDNKSHFMSYSANEYIGFNELDMQYILDMQKMLDMVTG